MSMEVKMSKLLLNGKYACSVCDREFDSDLVTLTHEKEHDIIYVPFTRLDLFKLIQFIFSTRNEELLSPSLIKTLRKYTKGEYR